MKRSSALLASSAALFVPFALLGIQGALEDCEGSATFEIVGTEVVMDGEIDEDTEDRLFSLLERNPHVTTLVLKCVPGSEDDEANVQLGRRVNRSGLAVRVPDFRLDEDGEPVEGFIASGGVDLFLAGTTRTLGTDACVGIHSWADSDGTNGSELPESHPDHQMFIEYYQAIGYGYAVDFYFATLEAAPPDGMYYMTAEELEGWGFAPEARGGCPLPQELPNL